MSTIVERVRSLQLPLDQMVVIAGGVLDGLGLRQAGDIDLVLSAQLFAVLTQMPGWRVEARRNELVLLKDDVEAFLSWASESRPNFAELYEAGLTVDGVRIAAPRTVIADKKVRASDKDLADIALLEGYCADE